MTTLLPRHVHADAVEDDGSSTKGNDIAVVKPTPSSPGWERARRGLTRAQVCVCVD